MIILHGGSPLELIEIILIAAIGLLSGLLIIWSLASSIIIIQEYETGVYMRLGRYVKNLSPGLHLVAPFVSKVYKADRRIQTIDLGRQEVMTKDLSPTIVEALIQYTLDKPDKSLMNIDKYRSTLTHLAQSNLRKIALKRDLDSLIRDQEQVNKDLFQRMVKEGEAFGISIVRTEIKDVDPVGPVKAAIEDRIAAEKERQAMILRADGRKRALILEREGRGG